MPRKRRAKPSPSIPPTPDGSPSISFTPSPNQVSLTPSPNQASFTPSSDIEYHALETDRPTAPVTLPSDPLTDHPHQIQLDPGVDSSSVPTPTHPMQTPMHTLPSDTVYTVAHVATAISQEIIDWAIMDVVLDAHRRHHLPASQALAYGLTPHTSPTNDLQTQQPSAAAVTGAASTSTSNAAAAALQQSALRSPATIDPSAGGHVPTMQTHAVPPPWDLKHIQTALADARSHVVLHVDKNVSLECSVCASLTAASRYAQHLEKCLGRGGRSSSRAASARLKASAEKAEKEAAADQDHEYTARRRRSATTAAASSLVVPGSDWDPSPSHYSAANALGTASRTRDDFQVPNPPPTHTGGSKRRKSSPGTDLHTAGTGAHTHITETGRKSGHLPPSGRSRP